MGINTSSKCGCQQEICHRSAQDPSQKTFQGDNFVRRAGDFDSFQALNLHSVAATNRGQDISMMVCNADSHTAGMCSNSAAPEACVLMA